MLSGGIFFIHSLFPCSIFRYTSFPCTSKSTVYIFFFCILIFSIPNFEHSFTIFFLLYPLKLFIEVFPLSPLQGFTVFFLLPMQFSNTTDLSYLVSITISLCPHSYFFYSLIFFSLSLSLFSYLLYFFSFFSPNTKPGRCFNQSQGRGIETEKIYIKIRIKITPDSLGIAVGNKYKRHLVSGGISGRMFAMKMKHYSLEIFFFFLCVPPFLFLTKVFYTRILFSFIFKNLYNRLFFSITKLGMNKARTSKKVKAFWAL